MKKNLDIVDEVTAEKVKELNERRSNKETRRKREVRQSIDQYQEERTLRRELAEYN